MLVLLIMHQPGNMDSLLHWSHAELQSACGTARGRERRQARFWKAGTHVLVIALSGFISVNMFMADFIFTFKLLSHTRAHSFSHVNLLSPLVFIFLKDKT